MNNQMSPRNFLVRFQVYNEHPSFGKGVVTLMELIKQGHTLKSAAENIGMAYSKAWIHFKKAEEDLDIKLIVRKTGGTGGGGATLTEDGTLFLEQYHRFEAGSTEAVAKVFELCFPHKNEGA